MIEWLEQLDIKDRPRAVMEAFNKVASTQEGKIVIAQILVDLYFFERAETPEQQALNNYAKQLVMTYFGGHAHIRVMEALLSKERLMPDQQAAAPAKDNAQTVEEPGQDNSILTGKIEAEGTKPSAEGTASEMPKWMAQLPEDLKADKSLTKFATIGDLGKSYKELEGKLGTSVTIPGPQASDEERARFRKAMGVPDKPTDYKIEKAKLPQGVFEKTDDRFLELAHTTGLTPDQVKAVHAFWNKEILQTISTGLKTVKATMQETETALRTELGSNYDLTMSNAQRFLREFDDETVQLISRSGLGNHKGFILGFAKAGARTAEHKIVEGAPAGVGVKPLEEIMYPGMKPK